MNLLEEYKTLYYAEHEHSCNLNGKITTCLTLLTILGAGEIFILKELVAHFSLSWYCLFFATFCVISSIMFIKCIYSFIKAYSGYYYKYFPIDGAKEFISKTQNATAHIADREAICTDHIKGMFERRYLNCAIHNQEQNEKKHQRHRNLNIWIIRTFIVIIFTFLIWILCLSNSSLATANTIHIQLNL